MSFRAVEIGNSDSSTQVCGGGERLLTLTVGGCKLEILGSVCDNFSESNALTGKFRLHRTDDNLTASLDLEKVIPFGGEYRLRRRLEFSSAAARITVDVQGGSGGLLRQFVLDPVRLKGNFRRVGVLPWDGSRIAWHDLNAETTIFYESEKPFLLLTVETDDGCRIDLGGGIDLWRQAAGARLPGSSAGFRIGGNAAELQIERRILDFKPGADIPKRPWRFEYFLAWHLRPQTENPAAGDEIRFPALDLPPAGARLGPDRRREGYCQVAAAVRRRLHDLVRGSDRNLILTGIEPGICLDAGHLERPGQNELPHWDLPELFALHTWANRQLAKRNGRVLLQLDRDSMLQNTATAAVLAAPLAPLTLQEQ